MQLNKLHTFASPSNWKFVNIANDTFLVNESDISFFIVVKNRVKFGKLLSCDGNVEDVELFKTDSRYIFKLYDDLYEITDIKEIEYIEFVNYDYDNDDVMMLVKTDDYNVSFISFWYESDSDENETFCEIGNVDLRNFKNVLSLPSFVDNLFYYNGFFYYKNNDCDEMVLRFSSQKLDTYHLPNDAHFIFNVNNPYSLLVRFDNNLIDVINFKLYDISDIIFSIGSDLDYYKFNIYHLSEENGDFIFLYDNEDLYGPNLVLKGNFTMCNGFLYDYSSKQFLFSNYSYMNGKINSLLFMVYDYAIPNLIKTANGYLMFYLDYKSEIKYISLSKDVIILSNLEIEGEAQIWNRAIFTNESPNVLSEENKVILLSNSIMLCDIIESSILESVIHMENESDAIRYILAQQFGRNFARKLHISGSIKFNRVFYLFADDCFTIKTPFSIHGSSTVISPRYFDKLDFEFSFNSYTKFTLTRNTPDFGCAEHIILKCIQNDELNDNSVSYIDVTEYDIVSLRQLISDALENE